MNSTPSPPILIFDEFFQHTLRNINQHIQQNFERSEKMKSYLLKLNQDCNQLTTLQENLYEKSQTIVNDVQYYEKDQNEFLNDIKKRLESMDDDLNQIDPFGGETSFLMDSKIQNPLPFSLPILTPTQTPPNFPLSNQNQLSSHLGGNFINFNQLDLQTLLEKLVVLASKAGNRTSKSYISWIPVYTSSSSSFLIAFFVPALAYLFQKMFDYYSKQYKNPEKLIISNDMIENLFKNLDSEINSDVKYPLELASKCSQVSSFYVRLRGYPALHKNLRLIKELQRNVLFVTPNKLADLIDKHSDTFQGPDSVLNIEKRNGSRTGFRGLKSTYSNDIPSECSFTSWIPYPSSQKFFVDNNSFMAWNAFFNHQVGKKITSHANPEDLKQFGMNHLTWNWKVEKNSNDELISVESMEKIASIIPISTYKKRKERISK